MNLKSLVITMTQQRHYVIKSLRNRKTDFRNELRAKKYIYDWIFVRKIKYEDVKYAS